eukprot:5173182-Amphidinium_carterae.1
MFLGRIQKNDVSCMCSALSLFMTTQCVLLAATSKQSKRGRLPHSRLWRLASGSSAGATQMGGRGLR